MSKQLRVSVGACSQKGRKQANQDFHGACMPVEPDLTAKGIVLAVADGISSSMVSRMASEMSVRSLLEDYYCTPQAWTVRKSVQRVMGAMNSWLHAQSLNSQYPYDRDRGYVCTCSALVLKSTTAHLFHVGDSRIYRCRGERLEQLTRDHCLKVGETETYLNRAMGMDSQLEIDYQAIEIQVGDFFLLMSDGVYEFLAARTVVDILGQAGVKPDRVARDLVSRAFDQGSEDNLTVQLVRIDSLPDHDAAEHYRHLAGLPFAPLLEPGREFDGFRILRELSSSNRSRVYLASDVESAIQVVLKLPSTEMENNPVLLESFLMEEWISRRLNSPHILKGVALARTRHFLYMVTEYVEGQTLTQWMRDNPAPELESVRDIVEQLAKGLQAFHRMEMLHQDLRPDNILITREGTVKIIDFGSTRVAGVMEVESPLRDGRIPGTVQYAAPEYFLAEAGTAASDLFSLGVITYQMLSGKLPYRADVAKCRTRRALNRLVYRSVLDDRRAIPVWVDETLRKAVHPSPGRRYGVLSEFLYDLRHPNRNFVNRARPPLLESNPLLVWQTVSLVLAILLAVSLFV